MRKKISPEGDLRTKAEKEARKKLAEIFINSSDGVEIKLENFPKYVRRQNLTRFLVLYELFKKILPIKGSIIECGVHRGFGLMAWANLSAILEPVNLTRRMYGFDTFGGFPFTKEEDKSKYSKIEPGQFSADSFDELKNIIKIYDSIRFLGHIDKVNLIRGDAVKTIPKFVKENKHLVVRLLF